MIAKIITSVFTFLAGAIFSLAKSSPALAQPTEIQNRALSPRLLTHTGVSFTSLFVSNIITILFIAALVVAVVYFLINGIRVITAGGNKEQYTKGREGLTTAVIGLVVLFLLYLVLNLLGHFFDTSFLSIDITPLLLR